MNTVNLEAYIKYSSVEIENEVVELCSNYNFDDVLTKSDDSGSGALRFLDLDHKKNRSLILVLKGKKEILDELDDRGVLQ